MKENSLQFEYFYLALDDLKDIVDKGQLLIFVWAINKQFRVPEEPAALSSVKSNQL